MAFRTAMYKRYIILLLLLLFTTKGITLYTPAGLLSLHSLPNTGLGKDRNPLAPLLNKRSTGSPT